MWATPTNEGERLKARPMPRPLQGGWDLPTAATARTTAAEYMADNLAETLPAPAACPAEPTITPDSVCYETGTRQIWITTPWDSSDYLMRVEICDAVKTSFASVIGFTTMTVCRHAIAEVEPPTPGAPGGPAIQAFSPDEKKAFETSGNAGVWTNGDVYIGSDNGESFVADGDGGVTVLGETWYNAAGACANPPPAGTCGTPGFLSPPGNLPVECDPAGIIAVECPGGLTHFDDYYLNSAPRSIVLDDLRVCLETDFAGGGCSFYDPGGTYPVHAERLGVETAGPLADKVTDPDNPTCAGAPVTMDPGYYSTSGAYKIKGCVIMNPGIYMFAGGLTVDPAWLQGNDVFIINADPSTIAKVSKSAVCLTGITGGSFANFLYYQNPANDNLFVITSDSLLFLAGIIYNPAGGIEINGADTSSPWAIGGDGSAATGCLGQTTLLGGSIVGTTVKVKSDGTLSINAFADGAAADGGGWVRLYE